MLTRFLKLNLLILLGHQTDGLSKTQIICQSSESTQDAVKYLNEKLTSEFIVFDALKYDKDAQKYDKTQGFIKPKSVSAPSITDKTICVTVSD